MVLGAQITAARLIAVGRLGQLARSRFELFGSGKRFELGYLPSIGAELIGLEHNVEALEGRIAVLLAERLRATRRDELRRGVTLTGPHRDDVSLKLDDMEVGVYGSRGQQRLTLVALKLAEADLMTERAGESPVVLLDDVLSELDVRNRDLLLKALADGGDQVIVTTADPELLAGPHLDSLPRIRVTSGTVAS
jgi:DNA replication and repair protein RecF